MAKKFVLVGVLSLITLLATGRAQDAKQETEVDAESWLKKATSAYSSKEYADAAKYYVLAADSGINTPGNLYNAACCFSLIGSVDEAFITLSKAIDAGFANHTTVSNDTDLNNLRSDSRYDEQLKRIDKYKIVITSNIKQTAEEAEFVFDDAFNFVRAMKLVDEGAELIPTLEIEYFAKASAGLKQLITKYPFTVADLARSIEKYPEDFKNILHKVERLKGRVGEFRAAYKRYKEFAPGIVFPPTFFLIDRHRNIGSGSPDGSLICIERRTDESIDRIETLLIHELTHFQQLYSAGSDEFYAVFGPKKTLLALTIREGAAEFIADRITNRITQEDTRVYAAENEAELWARFQKQMMSNQTGDWMWATPSNPDQPRDLGYGFGARIVAAFYENATDKRRALQEIFAVIDYVKLLENSNFGKDLATN